MVVNQSIFVMVKNLVNKVITHLNAYSNGIPPLFLRLILAWEFGESGFEKLHGTNWFADLAFPFPFNLLTQLKVNHVQLNHSQTMC